MLVINMDYAFMGNRDAEEEAGKSQTLMLSMIGMSPTILKLRFVLLETRSHESAPQFLCPKKGADREDWNLKESLRLLEVLGYPNIAFKV